MFFLVMFVVVLICVALNGHDWKKIKPCQKCGSKQFTAHRKYTELQTGGPDDICDWAAFTETLTCNQCGQKKKPRNGAEQQHKQRVGDEAVSELKIN